MCQALEKNTTLQSLVFVIGCECAAAQRAMHSFVSLFIMCVSFLFALRLTNDVLWCGGKALVCGYVLPCQLTLSCFCRGCRRSDSCCNRKPHVT